MKIANREIRGVTDVTEVNLVTPTMAIFHLYHLHPKTTTATTNPLAVCLDLRVAAVTEMDMAVVAEALHHPRPRCLLSLNHLKVLHLLLSNKAIILAMVEVAEIAALKATTTIVARAVAMEVLEEEMMVTAVDIDEMMAGEAEEEEEGGKADMADSKEETKPKDKDKDREDVRKGNEEVRVSLVDTRARGEDSRFLFSAPSVPVCTLVLLLVWLLRLESERKKRKFHTTFSKKCLYLFFFWSSTHIYIRYYPC